MRLAEAKLLEMALRFSGDNYITDPLIEVFDTPIPRSSVPCLSKHRRRRSDFNDDFVIHGIKVSPSQKQRLPTNKPRAALPLVLLHGYGGASAYYYRNLVGLHSYFPVIFSLDMLGWGLSSRPRFSLCDKSVETAESFFVDSLEAWRVKHDIDKMILGGHSMGGYLSVAYCEKYPDRVQRLLLVSPAGTPEATDEAYARLQEMIGSGWSRKMALSTYRYLFNQGRSIGEILRSLPKKAGLARVAKFVNSFPAITDEDERRVLTSYLYYNMVLPGSGEYCINRFLNHFAFAKHPTIHRIPNLRVEHVSFFYGDRDFMDIHTGGLAVQRVCAEKRSQRQSAPTIAVYRIRDAGHLPMWGVNTKEFNAGIILGAGGCPRDALGPDTSTPAEEFFQKEDGTREQADAPNVLQSRSVKRDGLSASSMKKD
jgi:cardiolipin-specific phospholipase